MSCGCAVDKIATKLVRIDGSMANDGDRMC